jgi:hypothetical protein
MSPTSKVSNCRENARISRPERALRHIGNDTTDFGRAILPIIVSIVFITLSLTLAL